MNLRTYRIENGFGMAEIARLLGIGGVNPGGTYVRIENGSRPFDADMAERVLRLTGGAVTVADMHETRLDWLKANRPEKFIDDAPAAGTTASPSAAAGDVQACPAAPIEAWQAALSGSEVV